MNGCILVENRSTDCSTSFHFEMTDVKGLLSSRHGGCDKWTQDNVVLRKVESKDTIPPRSFQIVSWWSPWSGNWKYQSAWSIKFGSPKSIGSYHHPALPLSTFVCCSLLHNHFCNIVLNTRRYWWYSLSLSHSFIVEPIAYT